MRGLAILVAEDDHELREAMVGVLAEHGHHVEEASNGALALEKALLRPPTVAIVDFHMPVADGPTLIESLRLVVRPRPVIVGISGYPAAARWSADHGVNIFQAKPFALDRLLAAVEHAADCADGPPSDRGVITCGCVLGVGVTTEGVASVLPAYLQYARVVLIDSPTAASRFVRDVVPDLIVVFDPAVHRAVLQQAEAQGVPWRTLRRNRPSVPH